MSVSSHNEFAPDMLRMLITGSPTRTDALIVLESVIVGAMLFYFPGNPDGQAEMVEAITDRALERLAA